MSENVLIVADSENDANMRYAVRMFVPDPFIYLQTRRRPTLVLTDLEFDRGRREASHCRILSRTRIVKQLQHAGIRNPQTADIIHALLKESGIRKVAVPENFPLGLARELSRRRIKLKPRPDPFFPERDVKSSEEVKKISAALAMAEVGLAEAIHALKNAKIGKMKRLMYRNAPLTSERLRSIIDTAVLQAGGLPANTIVAGGTQSCDPHERGFGPLRAGEPIILDVFPRSQTTGYFGDITRTVVKGRASDALRQMYRTVSEAQDVAFAHLKGGASPKAVHLEVCQHFQECGYRTGRRRGHMEGFFHSTGHGLGLDLHETLILGNVAQGALKPGNVVTIEPGLYYPGIGGVRLEDVALVQRRSARNLTRFEKIFEV